MTKEQTPPLVSDELALQCKKEADEMYPPHLAPDEVIGDHFMLVRYAVANALYRERSDRQKTREVVQALVNEIMKNMTGYGEEWEDVLALAKSINIEPTKP